MPDSKQTAIGKRQGIASSNKIMLIWVAGASVIIGFAAVVSWFLWQQIAFKTSVVNAKNETVAVLKDNNDAVEVLQADIRVLSTNPRLKNSRASDDQNPVQVVLDALPADVNELALGASLQKRFIGAVDGIRLEALEVEPADIDGSGDEDLDGGGEIRFRLEVKATDPNRLKELLSQFERSIRVIDIDSLVIERTALDYTMTIDAHAYYEPPKVIELKEEVF